MFSGKGFDEWSVLALIATGKEPQPIGTVIYLSHCAESQSFWHIYSMIYKEVDRNEDGLLMLGVILERRINIPDPASPVQ